MEIYQNESKWIARDTPVKEGKFNMSNLVVADTKEEAIETLKTLISNK